MKWSERSVRGRAATIRAAAAMVLIVCAAVMWRHPFIVIAGIAAGIPLTIAYFAIACPRCGQDLLHPLEGAREPRTCPRCGLSTRDAWPQTNRSTPDSG